jgi:hypothetical protein
MRQIGCIFLGVSLALGTAALLGQPPTQTDQPKAEKRKVEQTKDEKSDKGKGKAKNNKRKAEEPKAGKG